MLNSLAVDFRPISIGIMKNVIKNIYIAQRNNAYLTTEKLASILHKSLKSIKNGIVMLKNLKLLAQNDYLKLNNDVFRDINNNKSITELILNKIIIFPLFSEYLFLLRIGKDDLEAANFLKVTYSINWQVSTIKSTFNGWIRYFKIKVEEEDLKSDIIVKTLKNTKDKVSALLLIRKIYGGVFNDIPEVLIKDLIEGIIVAATKPEDSLTDTGRALENFLRIKFKETNLRNCNGIGQISFELKRKKLISNKHHNILMGLNSLRIIGDAHGIDKEENRSWSIDKKSALLYCAQVLRFIKSVNSYCDNILSY